MKTLTIIGLALLALSASPATAAPAAKPAPADKPACTASIEVGKKYHWVTYQGGAVHRSGYVLFTDKKHGAWSKVVHFTDQPKAKATFWGRYDELRVTFKSGGSGERWTAWMKMCEGPKLSGNVYVGGKSVRTFHLDTSRVRD